MRHQNASRGKAGAEMHLVSGTCYYGGAGRRWAGPSGPAWQLDFLHSWWDTLKGWHDRPVNLATSLCSCQRPVWGGVECGGGGDGGGECICGSSGRKENGVSGTEAPVRPLSAERRPVLMSGGFEFGLPIDRRINAGAQTCTGVAAYCLRGWRAGLERSASDSFCLRPWTWD